MWKLEHGYLSLCHFPGLSGIKLEAASGRDPQRRDMHGTSGGEDECSGKLKSSYAV